MIKIIFPLILLFSSSFPNTGSAEDKSVFTLYRTSIVDSSFRIHIATFNAKDGYGYNLENCELAAKLFQNQPYVKTKFWCEIGLYKD